MTGPSTEPFDPLAMPLSGIRLVEASAGTGKTFSLAGLYLRLVVEQGLDVREVLVMTFTRAATQELRERLRARLALAARIAAEAPEPDRADAAEAFVEAVIARASADRATLAARLREAATRIDQATITTIHGFAQRAAAENAFDSALPFDRGEAVDDREIRREVAADYWRARVFGRPAQQAAAFLELWASPEALHEALAEVLGKPHAQLLHPDTDAVERARRAAAERWPGDRAAFVALLERAWSEDALLAKSGLRAAIEARGAEGLAAAIDAGLAGTVDGLPGLPDVVADLGDDEGVRRHAKKSAAGWFRPQDLEAVARVARLQVDGRLAAAAHAVDAIRDLARARKRERRLYSFDDLITGLHEAVADPARGPALAAALRRTWPWALVDEFQDTDPLQYAILRTIYATPGPEAGAARMERSGTRETGPRISPSAPSGLRHHGDGGPGGTSAETPLSPTGGEAAPGDSETGEAPLSPALSPRGREDESRGEANAAADREEPPLSPSLSPHGREGERAGTGTGGPGETPAAGSGHPLSPRGGEGQDEGEPAAPGGADDAPRASGAAAAGRRQDATESTHGDTAPTGAQHGHEDPGSARPGGLILIGDPKQAIYGFRGGDVFAYLDAAGDAHCRYGMDTNFRSSPAVVHGLDALFAAGGPRAFVLDGIAHRGVTAGRPAGDVRLEYDGHELSGVTAWSVPADADTGKEKLQGRIRAATVARIAALLDDARFATADGDRALRPGEVAVLVNSNREATAMQRALGAAGVPAVCIQPQSVFAQPAARELLWVLRAAAAPFDGQRMRAALTTPLFGYRLGDLVALDDDEAAWSAETERFQGAHVAWSRSGVQAMLEPILQQAAGRVLGLDDGERRMTDYLHVAERLQAAEPTVFGMEGLVRWLEAAVAEAGEGEVAEADRVRLENDADLVEVTTVHKAKGLQWPVVFVPYAPWIGTGGLKKPSDPPLALHDDAGRAVVDLGSHDLEANRAQALREHRAEAVRSLYVALTRAEQAVYFVHGPAAGAQNGPLAWLLHHDDGADTDTWDTSRGLPSWLDATTCDARLAEVRAASGGALCIEALPEADAGPARRRAPAADPLAPARDDFPAPRPPWGVFSFSRLAGRMAAAEPSTGGDDETVAAPTAEAEVREPDAVAEVAVTPRGTGFGQAFHAVLEETAFDAWPAPGEAEDADAREQAAAALRRFGEPTVDADGASTPVERTVAMVAATLHAPLPGIGALAAVPAARRRAELEFFIRLGGTRASTVLERIAEAGYGGAHGAGAAATLNGLMHGYVDLVVEADGAYWIVDYKTNVLGPRRADYAPDRLGPAIAAHRYDLQYLIYLVALHRHLRQRLPGYDPALHLGGVLYLFVRGMDEGGRNGVFEDRPDPAFIETLDALLDGRGEEVGA